MQSEYAVTLLLIVLRRVNNNHTLDLFTPFVSHHLQTLLNLLFKLSSFESTDYAEECAKYLLLTEEILLTLFHAQYFTQPD
jgi:hypothetical protein